MEMRADELVPMLWPSAWKEPSSLDLLTDSAIDCLLMEKNQQPEPLLAEAARRRFTVLEVGQLPAGVRLVKGVWPGVKLSERSEVQHASSGPTGEPWVDSNGWKIRLASELQPGRTFWVEAKPEEPWTFSESYLIALTDAATYGARWIISLDDKLAQNISDGKAEGLQTWDWLRMASRFFASRRSWASYEPMAVVGILSDFAGSNERSSNETLNLVARTNQQYRVLIKDKLSRSSFGGLRALIYPDAEVPAPQLRNDVIRFVQSGGLLITGNGWGIAEDTIAEPNDNPAYGMARLGNGRIAVPKSGKVEPYQVAEDSLALISHRHDLLRFWNGGAVGSFMTTSPDRKRMLVQVLFYAGVRGRKSSVRVAGRFRTATFATFNHPVPREVEREVQNDAVEIHLPPVPQYAAIELEIEGS